MTAKKSAARKPAKTVKGVAAAKSKKTAAKQTSARAKAKAPPKTAARRIKEKAVKLVVVQPAVVVETPLLKPAAKVVVEVREIKAVARDVSPARRETPVQPAATVAPPIRPTVATAPSGGVVNSTNRAPKPGAATKSADSAGAEESGIKLAKNSLNRQGFKASEYVVYPSHGVGQIVSIEEQEVAGFTLELFVINFAKDKMTLRVPTSKVIGVGMRKLSDPDGARKALDILTGRPRVKRTMWSRRAQEYEAKINSGDIDSIAEVVRDLYRSEAQPEQSYSERQLYEAALDRMAREIAVVQKIDESEALKVIAGQLQKSQKRLPKPDATGADMAQSASVDEAA